MIDYESLIEYLCQFLRTNVEKTSLKNVVLGLSGGIDSAVVAVLTHRVFGDRLLCVMMPSHYSSKGSIDDAIELCEKFDIRYEIASIETMLRAFEAESSDLSNLRIGNASARLRMIRLFDISARDGALVLGTSNKSEILLGYTTMYGDSASAINPIGDLYKTEIFELARALGVNEAIVNKPPSADLWEGQSDEEEIGYSYEQIDSVLKLYIEEQKSIDDLLNYCKSKQLIDMITNMVSRNRFKRQMPLVATVGAFRGNPNSRSVYENPLL